MSTNVSINGNRVAITTSEGDALRQSKQTAQTAGNPLDSLTLTQALTWIDNKVSIQQMRSPV
jgi:hypothetical protein